MHEYQVDYLILDGTFGEKRNIIGRNSATVPGFHKTPDNIKQLRQKLADDAIDELDKSGIESTPISIVFTCWIELDA